MTSQNRAVKGIAIIALFICINLGSLLWPTPSAAQAQATHGRSSYVVKAPDTTWPPLGSEPLWRTLSKASSALATPSTVQKSTTALIPASTKSPSPSASTPTTSVTSPSTTTPPASVTPTTVPVAPVALAAPAIQSSAPTSASSSGTPPDATQVAEWDKVNVCEEGGNWSVDGAIYSGGLGFSHANWTQFNTFGFAPDAAEATPLQQIQVAVAFAIHYFGSAYAAPDQNGCGGGY